MCRGWFGQSIVVYLVQNSLLVTTHRRKNNDSSIIVIVTGQYWLPTFFIDYLVYIDYIYGDTLLWEQQNINIVNEWPILMDNNIIDYLVVV